MNPNFSPNAHYLIACERERQVFKLGYDSKHDDRYIDFELAKAAQCYLDVALFQLTPGPIVMDELVILEAVQRQWPWAKEAFKPAPSVAENLVKAGALFAAEKMRIWRRGDKVLANSYEASINHCARLLQNELNGITIPFHEATLTGTEKVYRCAVEKIPGDREITVGVADDGTHAIRITRPDESGRTSNLTFCLTPEAFAAMVRAAQRIQLMQDDKARRRG